MALGELKRDQEAIKALQLFIQHSDDQAEIDKAKDRIKQLGGTP